MPESVFFILYAVFILAIMCSKHKKHALCFNILACLSCTVYFLMESSYAGSVACIAAALGSGFQLFTMQFLKNVNMHKLMKIKLIGCALFTAIGIACVYQAPSDLYLIIGIIACRSGEILPKEHQVKLGYTMAEGLWLFYAADKGLMPLFAIHLSMTAIGTLFLLKHYTSSMPEWTQSLRMEILYLTRRPARVSA